MKKTVWTLNVDNYAPEVIALTMPLLRRYATKCQADFRVITERRFPKMPPVYEKLQLFELGQCSDWNIYIDADAVVHPDLFDPTNHLSKDTVCHNGNDMAGNRWLYDQYFLRDGRHIGSCNWFTIASDWCLDLWKPLDMTLQDAVRRIRPIINELATHVWTCQSKKCNYTVPTDKDSTGEKCTLCGEERKKFEKAIITPEHLIDDFTLSRNIARFGLKFTTLQAIQQKLGDRAFYLHHIYTQTKEQKVEQIKNILTGWGISNL